MSDILSLKTKKLLEATSRVVIPNIYNNTNQLSMSSLHTPAHSKRSPELIGSLSPKIARDYLQNLKQFVGQYRSQEPKLVKHLYCEAESAGLKIQQNQIELRSANANGKLKSIRFFHTENPILQSITKITFPQHIHIVGLKNSGKKKLAVQIIEQLKESFRIGNLELKDIAETLKRFKNQDIVLTNPRHTITITNKLSCQGFTIIAIRPQKQTREALKQTLKFIEL